MFYLIRYKKEQFDIFFKRIKKSIDKNLIFKNKKNKKIKKNIIKNLL